MKTVLLVTMKDCARQAVGVATKDENGVIECVLYDEDIPESEYLNTLGVFCQKCALSMCAVIDMPLDICECCRSKHTI